MTATSAFSQNGFPTRVVINDDTVVIISDAQVKELNQLWLRAERDSRLVTELRLKDSLSQLRISRSDSISNSYYAVTLIQAERLAEAQRRLEQCVKKSERQGRHNRLLLSLAVIEAAIIAVFVSK